MTDNKQENEQLVKQVNKRFREKFNQIGYIIVVVIFFIYVFLPMKDILQKKAKESDVIATKNQEKQSIENFTAQQNDIKNNKTQD